MADSTQAIFERLGGCKHSVQPPQPSSAAEPREDAPVPRPGMDMGNVLKNCLTPDQMHNLTPGE